MKVVRTIQRLIHNNVKYARIEELLESGEKNKDSFYLSILQSGKHEAKSMLEFSNDSLSLSCNICDDLNTTPNFQLSKILDYAVKSSKCAKIEGNKNLPHYFSYF